ncbi:MAG: hypothetical protein ACE14M_12500 [Terriglobales bacterium]
MEPMYFLDDEDDLRTMQALREERQQLEQEHLQTRIALRDAHAALRAEPESKELKDRVEELERKLDQINKQAAWILMEHPVEMLLWGAPHG